MSRFNNLLVDEKGKIIISIIWGLGLAVLFRKVCKGRECIIIKSPRPIDMHNKVYSFNDKCYQYKAIQTKCEK